MHFVLAIVMLFLQFTVSYSDYIQTFIIISKVIIIVHIQFLSNILNFALKSWLIYVMFRVRVKYLGSLLYIAVYAFV